MPPTTAGVLDSEQCCEEQSTDYKTTERVIVTTLREDSANAAKGRHVPLALMSDPEFRASATLVASGCGAVYCVVCTIESVVGVPPCTDPTPWVVFVPAPCSDPAPVFESALAPSPAPVIPAAASVADAATCCPEACHARVHATPCMCSHVRLSSKESTLRKSLPQDLVSYHMDMNVLFYAEGLGSQSMSTVGRSRPVGGTW